MQADISRQTFDATKHYDQVVMQQGRVQLDADWNEQQAIYQHRIETEASDIIGACGAPIDNAGFQLSVQKSTTAAPDTVLIGKGRYYVDGILCENESDVLFTNQPFVKHAQGTTPPDILELLRSKETLWAILYLDVWKRHITPLDDPAIREVALNGPDTTTRLQTVWQVGVLPLALPREVRVQNGLLRDAVARLSGVERAAGITSAVERTRIDEIVKAIREGSSSTDTITPELRRLASLRGTIESASQVIAQFSSQMTCITKSDEWDALTAPSTGTLTARTEPVEVTNDPCLIPPSAGYKRLENQLYRVEVHLPSSNSNGPTFKWSRENGSVITSIVGITGSDLHVHDLGRDEVLGFAIGQWAEIISDETELSGQPGQLVQISDINPASLTISLASAPKNVFDSTLHFKLRRWEQVGATATTDGVRISTSLGWLDLEDGIQVQFSQGTYKTGDFWLIPARTATGDIDWPHQDGPTSPSLPQPRLGIQHHYCRLALLRLNPRNGQFHLQDCRTIFGPLTSPAMHVVGINWKNDDFFSPQQFLKEGLRITLDAIPENQSAIPATVIVTVEGPASTLLGNTSLGEFMVSLIVDGTVRVENNVIHWMFQQSIQNEAVATNLDATVLANRLSTIAAARTNQGPLLRIRVVVKGHDIWSNQGDRRYYLDGQVFGQPDLQSDQTTPRIALAFPSGRGVMASDFESWLYLGEPKVPPPLRVRKVVFRSTLPNQNSQDIAVVDLTQVPPTSTAPPPPQTVAFRDIDEVNVIEITFSRAIQDDGIIQSRTPGILVVRAANGAQEQKIAGSLQFNPNTGNTIVQFTLPNRDGQQSFAHGAYRLTVIGNDNEGSTVIKAQDNGTALDGGFKGNPGGDFVQQFTVSIGIT